MKKVIEEQNVYSDNIKSSLEQIDFRDTFSTINMFDSLEVISNKIFNNTPRWIELLFIIRAFLVKLIGLKSVTPDDYNKEFRIGGYVGFFKVYVIDDKELILGLDEGHLKFRVSILNNTNALYNIKVTTLVEYNNKKGKLYMKFIAPFHRIVVKNLVKKAYISNT